MKHRTMSMRTEIALIFIIALSVFAYLQYHHVLRDPDAFYHLKMALLTKEQGVVFHFPWLKMTGLEASFADHHYLYHLLLVPFLSLGLSPLLAFKGATVFFAAMVVVSLYLFLTSQKIKGAFAWALYLLVSAPLIFRLSLGKANALSMIFMFAVLYALIKKKNLLLFATSFFFVWLHASWPVVLVFAFLYVLTTAWEQFNPKPFFVALFGIISGLILNPYFPKNISFYRTQIFEIAVKGYSQLISVGNEWRPMELWTFIGGNKTLSILTLMCLFLSIRMWRKMGSQVHFLFLITLFFSYAALRQIRMNEYFAPFATIFCAFVVDAWLTPQRVKIVKEHLRSFYSSEGIKAVALTACTALLLIFVFGKDIVHERNQLMVGPSVTRFSGVGEWLTKNTKKGETIFHTQWDAFPPLFLYNDHNTFLIGLDPVFAYVENKERYNAWLSLSQAQLRGIAFSEKFTATFPEISYILLEKDYRDSTRFRNQDSSINDFLKTSPTFFKAYEDGDSVVYKKN